LLEPVFPDCVSGRETTSSPIRFASAIGFVLQGVDDFVYVPRAEWTAVILDVPGPIARSLQLLLGESTLHPPTNNARVLWFGHEAHGHAVVDVKKFDDVVEIQPTRV